MNDFDFNENKASIEEKIAIAVFTISFLAFSSMPLIAMPISFLTLAISSYIKSKWKSKH